MKQRASRVAEELKKLVMQVLMEDLTHPGLGFITVTHVEVTDDLRFARVFYSVLGDEEQKNSTAEALQEQIGYIRRFVVERLNMKFAIDIQFQVDKSIDQSFRIDSILKQIKKDEPAEPDGKE